LSERRKVIKCGPIGKGSCAFFSVADFSTAEIDEGQGLNTHCLVCHGFRAASGVLLPDLRFATKQTYESWLAIVIGVIPVSCNQ
jgi:hypothetical protein